MKEIATETRAAAAPAGHRERGLRSLRWLRRAIKRSLVWLGVLVLPRIYLVWMWITYATSRVEHIGYLPATMREECGGGVWALWHDEVATVAYAFGRWRPDTLASQGDGGELISKALRVCGFNVFRGGSSRSSRRRSAAIVREMIRHMRQNEGILYGITTDGSHGPAYRMKRGVVTIAVRCAMPLAVAKTWHKRHIRLKTWDRTFVPLPFNHIVHVYMGPIYPPRDALDPDAFERLRQEVEHQLCRVTMLACHRAEGRVPEELIEDFPEHCREALREERPRIAELEAELKRPLKPRSEVIIDPLPEGAIDTLPGADWDQAEPDQPEPPPEAPPV